jgi:hypothetical protein
MLTLISKNNLTFTKQPCGCDDIMSGKLKPKVESKKSFIIKNISNIENINNIISNKKHKKTKYKSKKLKYKTKKLKNKYNMSKHK